MKYDLIHLNLNECKKHFNVGSTFSYYLIKKKVTNDLLTNVISEYNKEITNDNIDFKKLYNMNFLPVHINKDTLNLINKIINNENKLNIQRCRSLDTSAKTKKHLS